MITVSNISYQYLHSTVLKNISFQIQKGEIFGILGPNGSGKSTLLKIMSGSLPIKSGDIKIQGIPISEYTPKKLAKIIAVLPQSADFAFNYSVLESVRLGRYAHQNGIFPHFSDEDERIIAQSLEQTGLTGMKDKLLSELSGGERQRVFLARALSQEPDILMLDEPTNHLDISHQLKLLNSLSKWSKERGITVIAIFHDLNIASLFCDRVLILNNGKMVDINQPNASFCENRLSEVFQTPIKRMEHPIIPKPLITLVPDLKLYSESDTGVVINVEDTCIILKTKVPYKCYLNYMNPSYTWSDIFVIEQKDICDNSKIDLLKTSLGRVVLTTSKPIKEIEYREFQVEMISIKLLVSIHLFPPANPVDSFVRDKIDVMMMIDGKLSDSTFANIITIATEAKMMALFDENICDNFENHFDLMMVASSQTGQEIDKTIIPILLQIIKKSIYSTIKKAIQNDKKLV